MQLGDGRKIKGLAPRVEPALGGKVEHLPAGHPAEAGSPCQRRHELDPDIGIGVRFGARQDVEREGEQAIADQNGGRLVERLVHRGLPAAQIVVVHCGQVVVHQ